LKPPDDYLTIANSTSLYTDENFPTNDAIYWWDYTLNQLTSQAKSITWYRIRDRYPSASIFGTGVDPTDII